MPSFCYSGFKISVGHFCAWYAFVDILTQPHPHPTERGNYPFEVITMDFAEFTKSGETFIIMSDKYSGALHVDGVKKGGTGHETISSVVNFARSNIGNIKK